MADPYFLAVVGARGAGRSSAGNLSAALTDAPRVTMLVALVVDVIVFGPRRTAR